MFIELEERDRKKLIEYLEKEPEMNLFLLGDIENEGVKSDIVHIHANVINDKWDSIILQYFDNYILYSQNPKYDAQSAADFLHTRDRDCLSGKTELLERLVPVLQEQDKKLESTYMSRCNGIQSSGIRACPEVTVRALGPEDAAVLVDLYLLIDEFAHTYRGKEEKQKEQTAFNLKHNGTACGAFLDGRLVAAAATSADNSVSAMIVGVATHPEHRRKGYASLVVQRICDTAFQSGKQFLCLFYDNPEAGRIYNRIGFQEIGNYAMFR